ncbi:MAG: hypothetical protein Q4F39_00450 [Bacteroidia bacterium]|nr:hypothetical protein [Bacteroidia bacterium]
MLKEKLVLPERVLVKDSKTIETGLAKSGVGNCDENKDFVAITVRLRDFATKLAILSQMAIAQVGPKYICTFLGGPRMR